MNFDEAFDYTLSIAAFNNRLVSLQSQLNEQNEKLSLLQSSLYVSIVTNEINQLTSSILRINNTIFDIQLILDEITRIQNLSVEDKNLLYYFYTIVEDTSYGSKTKLLFNTTQALTDMEIQALLVDTTTPDNIRAIIANIIYNKYQIHHLLMQGLLVNII